MSSESSCPYCRNGKVWQQDGRYVVDCPHCHGTGRKGAKPPKKCRVCQGSGNNQGACVECNGTGLA